MRRAAAILAFFLALAACAPGVVASAGSGEAGSRETQTPPSGTKTARAPAGAVQGVVLAQVGGTLTVLARGNALLTVIVAGTAAISGAGNGRQAIRGEVGLARGSVVEISGPRNSDGSLSAQSVAILFDARRAARAAGRIVRPSEEGGFLLSDGAVVALGDEVWIFRGTTLLAPGALIPGIAVAVYGSQKGTRLVARVIEVSL